MLTIDPVLSTSIVTTATCEFRLPSKSSVTVVAERAIDTITHFPEPIFRARIVLHHYGVSADRYATFNVGRSARSVFVALHGNGDSRSVALLQSVFDSCDSVTGDAAFEAADWTSDLFAELAHELGFDADRLRKGFIAERATA